MKLFDNIVNLVSEYDVNLDVKDNELTIVNKDNGNTIAVYFEEYFFEDMTDSFVQYTVQFSTQHRHFEAEDPDTIIEYIQLILNDKVFPLEFYKDGKRRFGGEISRSDFDNLSVSFLSKKYGYTNSYILPFEYEIHSWSGRFDTGLKSVSDLI